jgi:hypothetical protein
MGRWWYHLAMRIIYAHHWTKICYYWNTNIERGKH